MRQRNQAGSVSSALVQRALRWQGAWGNFETAAVRPAALAPA